MPKGVIKTPEQEKKWEKAKEAAAEQGKAQRWPLVMHIFRQMGGISKADGEDKNVLIERAFERQGRKTAMPDEVHQVLHSWWNENKTKVLTPEQQQRLADIKATKNKPKPSLKLVKARELNNLYEALSALRELISEDLRKDDYQPRKRKKTTQEWTLSNDHTPLELENIKKLIQEGYHAREAAHLISGGKGGRGEHTDFQKALMSRVEPTMLSDKMLGEAKNIANDWLKNYEKVSGKYHEPQKNPIKYAEAQAKAIRDAHGAKFKKEWNEFLSSDHLNTLNPHEYNQALVDWEKNWHKNNPEYMEGLKNVEQQILDKKQQAKQARGEHIKEVMEHLVHGPPPAESASGEFEETPTTGRAVAEHMGMQEKEGEGPQYSTEKDQAMAFAAKNPKFIQQVLAPRVEQAKQALPKAPMPAQPASEAVSAPTKPEQPSAKAVIRRSAKPEQVERMNRIDAAKMAVKKE